MLPVDFLPDARRDFDESFDWYAARSLQASTRFTDAVDAALSTVADNPERFAAADGIHRECPIRRFPFRVVYRILGSRVLVVAIAHAKRRPGYWRGRG
ncbi:MAG: type II toxin-antitoxin system RelE/ParE family toxin [Thermoguttaceae bacterium]